jgi:hypothetical protein
LITTERRARCSSAGANTGGGATAGGRKKAAGVGRPCRKVNSEVIFIFSLSHRGLNFTQVRAHYWATWSASSPFFGLLQVHHQAMSTSTCLPPPTRLFLSWKDDLAENEIFSSQKKVLFQSKVLTFLSNKTCYSSSRWPQLSRRPLQVERERYLIHREPLLNFRQPHQS